MELTVQQKVQLSRFALGYRVRKVTIDALKAKGMLTAGAKPLLTKAGTHFVRTGALPPN